MTERIELPEGLLRAGDDLVSILRTDMGDVWVFVVRDGDVAIFASDLGWAEAEPEATIMSDGERMWIAGCLLSCGARTTTGARA